MRSEEEINKRIIGLIDMQKGYEKKGNFIGGIAMQGIIDELYWVLERGRKG